MNPMQDNNQPAVGIENTNSILSSILSQQPSQDPAQSGPSAQDIINQSGAQQHQSASTPELDSGNWFTHLLPTITSIGGGLLGTLADPFTMGMGTIAGGAAGSALGKSWQNALEGKDTTANDLGGSALEGAIGGGIGKGLELGAGALGKVVTGTGAKGIANAATAAKTGEELAAAQAARNEFGSVAKGFKVANNPEYGLKGAQDLAAKVGVQADEAGRVGQGMSDTGNKALDILDENRNNILAKSGAINTSGIVGQNGETVAPSLDSVIKASLNNANPITGESAGLSHTSVLGPVNEVVTKGKKLTTVSNASTDFLDQANQLLGSITNKSTVDPMEFLKAQQAVASAARTATRLANKGEEGANAEVLAAKAGAWNNLNNNLKDMMFNRPTVDTGVAGLKGNIQAADVGGNQMLADELNSRLASAQTGNDLNTSMSHFINMRNLGDEARAAGQDTSSSFALNSAKQVAGVGTPTIDAAGNPIADVAAASGHPVVKGLGKIVQSLNNGGMGSQMAVKTGSLLSRMGSGGNLAGIPIAAGAVIGNSPNSAGPASAGSVVGGGMTPDNQQSSGNIMQDIMNSNSPLALPVKMELSNMQNEQMHRGAGAGGIQQVNSSLSPAAAVALQQLIHVNTAKSQLAGLVSQMNQAGGAQGPVGGLLAQLSGALTGGPAAQYGQQAQQLTDQINQATGSHIAAPSLMMNQQGANNVLAQLQQVLAANGTNGGVSHLGQ